MVTVYWAADEVVFKTYDPLNSKEMRCSLASSGLKQWLTEELVWAKKRKKKERVAMRGHARRFLKRERLGLPVQVVSFFFFFFFSSLLFPHFITSLIFLSFLSS